MKENTPSTTADLLSAISDKVNACIQCGTCSASCPNAFAMDFTPRHLWRLLQAGETQAVLTSRSFSLCSTCYSCTLRCPRGLPLTDIMSALKQVGARQMPMPDPAGVLFHRNFLESVRRHGRVREMEFMTLYFSAMKNPLLPFHFASLGMRLLSRKKLPFQLPSRGSERLNALFCKVNELENTP
ncbi:MAG: 4Fe-4S dicluster domain-containing protein [Deltaproteobacteria bacterium]|nr:4Fe-4S dicluster domain-containing protein [Deltaproteobacteria bacterium]